MRRLFFGLTAAMLLMSGLKAQDINNYVSDIFNYSQLGLNGTASYVGRAGAIGALGADFNAASYNPAGLGFFYSSQISITPLIDYSPTHSRYMGVEADDSRTTFNIGSFEALFAIPTGKEDESFKAMQFGIGFNRLASFNNRTYVEGVSTPFSMLDVWCDQANTNNISNYLFESLWELYLLDTVPGTQGSTYYNCFKGHDLQQTQAYHHVTTGGINEMTISFSGNYSDKLYLGMTVGIPFLSYYSSSVYRETAESDPQKEHFDYSQNYEVNGTGINLKIGAIYRPVEMLRIGFALHTPTLYDIKDIYSESLYGSYMNKTFLSDEYASAYSFRTPMRMIASVAATFGHQGSAVAGSVDFDYEFANYNGMKFVASGDEYADIEYERWRNDRKFEISNTYKPGHTLRLGGSLNVRHLVLRAGAAYNTNPYKEQENTTYETKNAESLSIACGIGYRNTHFFIDFAYGHTVMKDLDHFDTYSSYNYYLNSTRNLFVTTIGFKF